MRKKKKLIEAALGFILSRTFMLVFFGTKADLDDGLAGFIKLLK